MQPRAKFLGGRPRAAWLGLAVAAAVAAGACARGKGIDRGGAEPGAAAGGGGGAGPGGGPGPTTAACEGGVTTLGAAPLRRLTRTEYENTLRDLFPGVALPALALGADGGSGRFDNDASLQGPTPKLAGDYAKVARAVATAAVQDVGKLVPCAADDPACGGAFARAFAAKAFRRPLTDDEGRRFDAFFAARAPEFGFPTAVRVFLEGVLQSASFLYRPEFEAPGATDGALGAVSPHELAARLSYFFWQTMPDGALRAAADDGSLADEGVFAAQAGRLAADPRARQAVREFYRQWLRLDEIKQVACDGAPGCTAETPAALEESLLRFIDYIYWEKDGTLADLLLSPRAYVNDAVAGVYGLPPGQGAELRPVELDPAQRAGLLTQAGLLAALGHGSPVIRRGVFVMNQLLCYNMQKPSDEELAEQAAQNPEPPGAGGAPGRRTHASGVCMGCHTRIDGIGFGLSNYGPLGEFRTADELGPVDARGVFPDAEGNDVPFEGALDLSRRLAESEQFRACSAKQWFRVSSGRMEQADDACAVDALAASLADPAVTLREQLVRVALSRGFRLRRSAGPG